LEFYDDQRDSEEPVAGGAYNEDEIGSEVNNFRPHKGKLYGFAQASNVTGGFNIGRIEPELRGSDSCPSVLVVSVARHQGAGSQVIVGWHRDATVMNQFHERPGNIYGGYNFACDADDAVLLPDDQRRFRVPKGAGAMGQANVFYPTEADGRPRNTKWILEALRYIGSYTRTNLLTGTATRAVPGTSAPDLGLALADLGPRSSMAQAAAGIRLSADDRKAIELVAMARATRYFRARGYDVEDVHKTSPFDLLCTKRGEVDLTVEVKGTTGLGRKVIVTRGEVESARGRRAALFVVADLTLSRHGKRVVVSGGEERCLLPWVPADADLTPISFYYDLPATDPAT
jgi:hypothetical protein